MDNVDGGSDLLFDIANVGDDNYPLFYSAKTGDELDGILNQIIRGLISDAIVVGTITDRINDAFYPVNRENGKPLEANDIIDLSGKWLCKGENNLTAAQKAAGYGKVSVLQDGTYQVEWKDQSISCEEPGWQGTVYVKAKEDLLGGNSLMINKDDATIIATGYKMKETDTTILRFKNSPASTNNQLTTKSISRESPLVNVNELGFNGNSTEWTVYLGEEVDPKEELKKLYENILVQEVVNSAEDTDNDTYEIPDKLVYTSQDSLHYALAPDDFTDQREGDTSGTAVTFKLMDLIRELIDQQIAESEAAHQADPSNPEKAAEYAFWNDFITVDENQNEILDWDHFIEESLKENGFSIPYHVYGISDKGSIKITLAKEIVEKEKIYTQEEGQAPVEATLQTSPHATRVVSELDGNQNYIPVEIYTLTAFYSPDYDVLPKGQGGKKSNDLVHVGTYGTMYQGHAAGTETSTNVHKINVFARNLTLIKTGMDGDTPITGDTAEFKIYRKATEKEIQTIQAAEAAEAARRQSFIDEGKESEYDPADAAPSRLKKRTELEPGYDPTADPDYNVTGMSASEIQALQTQMKNRLFVDDPELKVTTNKTNGTAIIEDFPMAPGNIYYMVETKAPGGYTSMPEALKIYIDYTDIFWEMKDEAADKTFITADTVYPGTTTKVIDSASGKPGIAYNWDQEYMEDGETENAKIQISSLTAQNWQVYYKPVTRKVIVANTERLVPVSNQFYIRNSPGVELPSTGGPGSFVFMIPGMVLIAIAGTMLLKKRKYF